VRLGSGYSDVRFSFFFVRVSVVLLLVGCGCGIAVLQLGGRSFVPLFC
jgi:hypothetical protein